MRLTPWLQFSAFLSQFRLKFSPSLTSSFSLCALREVRLRTPSLLPWSKLRLKLGLLFLFSLFAPHSAIQATENAPSCNSDYHQAAQPVPHSLTSKDLMVLHYFLKTSDIETGWRYLKNHGDGYARMAQYVVHPRFSVKTFFHHALIRTHWFHTTGVSNYETLFNKVAQQHFKQYLEILNTGYWPDSDQILLSYISALERFGIAGQTAFDLNWQHSFLQPLITWQDAVDLLSNRIVDPPQVCQKAHPVTSSLRVLADFLLMLPESVGYSLIPSEEQP